MKDLTIAQYTPTKKMKLSRIYQHRRKIYGDITEVRSYSIPQKVYVREYTQPEKSENTDVRLSSILRARQQIYDIVEGNFSFYLSPVFCTFTFAKNEKNVDSAVLIFRLFLRRYSRHFFGQENVLQYIAVAERQTRGAIHFHAVFFNPPADVLSERKHRKMAMLWRQGFVDVRDARRTLRGDIVFSLGAYLAKYLGKDNVVRFGKNNFFASRGLVRPRVDYPLDDYAEGDMIQDSTVDSRRGRIRIKKYKKCSK